MKASYVITACSFLLASSAFAQGPLNDRVEVNLPYSITVNGAVLPPGDYVIRQHESTAGGSRILHFFNDGGMKLETTAMAIPALDNRTPRKTELVLEHLGSDYYLNKIWVQGKDYGYEFPIPENIRRRELERNAPVAVVGQYKTEERVETAQAAPPPAAPPAPAPEPERPAPVATQPAPEPAPAPAVTPAEPAPAPAPEPARVQADQKMPATAGNWLNLMIGGSLLALSGLALRRFQRS
ncbi:MAG TPA: hypothetical protein VL285_13575 [Bryobacteraceae bacterium]|nr:hypothetical protein [Bryobacteraceae bacterium]